MEIIHHKCQLNNALSILLLTLCMIQSSYSLTEEMTVNIEAGQTACFFQTVKAKQIIDIEYQVIDGGHGDLDISFSLYSPEDVLLVQEYKKPDNIHRLTAHTTGDHKFCFDNSFSTFNRKTVFFEIIVESEDESDDSWGKEILDELSPEEAYDGKIEDIKDILVKLHSNLNKLKHDLDIRRSTEARDRNQAEENNFKVTVWSFLQICLMIIVGSIQVFMLRNLFETDPRVNVWKKFKVLN